MAVQTVPVFGSSVRFACIQMASDPRQEIRSFAVQGLTLPKVSRGRLPDSEEADCQLQWLLRRSDASRKIDLPPKAST